MSMAVLGIVVVEAATASCTQGANSGSGALGPVGSASGAASWNASNRHFTLHAAADSVLASGICADAWYDWLTVGGHHDDARVARTCQAGSTRYADGTDGYTEPSNSVSVRSMQKFSVCRSNGADMQNELLECHDSGCAYQGAEGNVIPNRRAAHDAGWSTLGREIAQFRADHATELAQEAAGWQALVKEANAGPWQALLP